MPVNFLDLDPQPAVDTVTLQTRSGPVELELTGVRLSTLTELARKYPAFARVVEGGAGSIIEASEAMPALIAAGLGHAGDLEYEAKVRQFGAADIMTMAMVVVRLTFPTAAPGPLADAAPNGAGGASLVQTSLQPLSS
jgi:hypothetical protein